MKSDGGKPEGPGPASREQDDIVVEGTITRVTFRNESDLYTVARVQTRDGQAVTVVGAFPTLSVGEEMRFWGKWDVHPVYGRQLKVARHQSLTPVTLAGIERYLASGFIKGVGQATAKKLVSRFGEKTLEVIEQQPRRLAQVHGIGLARAMEIHRAVVSQKGIRDTMVRLQGYGISPAYAIRIFRTYGSHAATVLERNPYRLAEEVQGIGFRTADQIALSMGLPEDSLERVEAAILHCLRESASEGHVMVPGDILAGKVKEMAPVDEVRFASALSNLEKRKAVVVDSSDGQTDGNGGSLGAVYLNALYRAEVGLAKRLTQLGFASVRMRGHKDRTNSLLKDIPYAEKRSGLKLADEQRAAVESVLQNAVSIVTGGPGTGKTTIVRILIQLFESKGMRVALAAPTGRAAKRLAEVTGREAKTIHRLLEYAPRPSSLQAMEGAPPYAGEVGVGFSIAATQTGDVYAFDMDPRGRCFGRNRDNPVDADVVVVDEASMVDIWLAYHLCQALKDGTRVVFVGDADQLPSVGPGNLLRDLIATRVFPTVKLTQIFRQAATSGIVLNAHRVNRGQMPILTGDFDDFIFIERENPEEVACRVVDVCVEMRAQGQYDVLNDVQVISPMKRGVAGVEELNRRLREALNPPSPGKAEVRRGAEVLRVGDRVIQVVNDYDKEVFNGDCGRITGIDSGTGRVEVAYPEGSGERLVGYDVTELDEIAPAFAVTVHKSQGNEFPAVVMPVVTQHYVMLQRNLLYTGMTRGKKLLIMVGSRKALAIAVRNDRVVQRFGKLRQRIAANVNSP